METGLDYLEILLSVILSKNSKISSITYRIRAYMKYELICKLSHNLTCNCFEEINESNLDNGDLDCLS